MLDLLHYRVLSLLSENSKTSVYRALRQSDQSPVILKTLTANYPSISEVAKLKHEYDITRNLDVPGISIPYALEEPQSKPMLVLEDFGGQDLTHWLRANILPIERIVWIAQQLAETLGQLHQKRIIHKDIKPQNIIFNPDTNQLKLGDFSIASRLSKENPTISSPNLIEGTLAYMSPEQTGRMNRVVDYRTDFYSLGITLYELLTGQLPFQSNDLMELVHCHIAKVPPPPHAFNPEVPKALSAIVLKLLAKTAEARYQSAYGIKADFETCLRQWQTKRTVTTFTLAQQDQRGTFSIPQKLYGRETEVQKLLAAFDRVAQGTTEMMLVSGYSGIGKSALVNEVHKPITRQRGYFISGKFDQFQRHIPYASLIQAFRELVRQLLTETEAQIATWRAKLTTALGNNGQVIVDVIPEVELILGPQPEVSELPPSEAQNRFNLVFRTFIHVFTEKEHPLVMFLDDLQWADAASLQLIQLLVTDPDSQYLLMLGAYRDNEVSSTHALIQTLSAIQTTGATLHTLPLRPLDLDHISALVSDTLHTTTTVVSPLAQLLHQKTQGNPFFLTQLFKYLYIEDVIQFNLKTGQWQWVLDNAFTIEITENVVDLMVREIQKLDDSTQTVLQLAACVGNQFDLDILAIVNEKSASATAAELWNALQSGLIVPLNDAYKIPQVVEDCATLKIPYKFLHDRVQQAAYSLIPNGEKQQVHLKVGRLLWKNTPSDEIDERIFDIVNPLNIGSSLMTDPTECLQLAQLNLQAGCKAKAANAYDSAAEYLEMGRILLPNNIWDVGYDLALRLYTEAVEVEYLLTRFETAQTLSEIVSTQAQTLLDKVKIYVLKIEFFIAQNQMLEAIDTALPVLELLGYPLIMDPNLLKLVRPLPQLDELATYPEMQDPEKLAVIQILAIISGPAYQARPEILSFINYRCKNLCLEYGHSPLAAYAYGLVIFPLDVALTYQCGQIALHILEQYPSDALKCKVNMLFNSFIGHWKEPHYLTINALEKTVQMGIETGDVVYAAYCAMFSCGYMMLTGMSLEEVGPAQQRYVDLLVKLKQDHGLYPAKTWRQLTQNLCGEAPDVLQLRGDYLNQQEVEHLESVQNQMLLFFVYCAEMILAYVMKDGEAVQDKLRAAAQYKVAVFASMLSGGFVFYETLVLLATYVDLPSEEKTTGWEKIQANTAQLAEWANHAPHNYQSKHELVLAEQARIQNRPLEAMEYYDRAIATAQVNRFSVEVGIAAERAAEFYQGLGREKIAQQYLLNAIYGYERWGAKAKVAALQKNSPILSRKGQQQVSSTFSVGTTLTQHTQSITGSLGKDFDLNTVIKAAQVLSGEIVFSKLISQLMSLALENAGAQLGYLLLIEQNQLTIAAVGQLDQTTDVESDAATDIDVEIHQPIPSDTPFPLSLIQYVQRTREPMVLHNAAENGLFVDDPYIVTHQTQSAICMPLLQQGQLVGMLYLENNLITGAFTDEHLQILGILATQAAISLENARFYQTLETKVAERTTQLAAANEEITQLNEQLKTENLRMGAELDIARRVQQMILPKAAELEALAPLAIVGYMNPADEVGGDYYDVLVDDGVITIGIGDVTGHGLESGLVMLMTQTIIRTLQELREADPVSFLNTVNSTLYKNLQRMDVDRNLSLAILNYVDGHLSISGQHEKVLLFRANGDLEQIDTIDLGITIGLIENIADFVSQTSFSLQPGDGVILYTDGIPEARNRLDEFYGLERLCGIVRQNWDNPVQLIQERIIADLYNFIGNQKILDDITLLVIKRQGL